VNCAPGAPDLLVSLTESASQALALAPGKSVWVIIKANSCHLLDR
jgi:ABC-type molybdate transport system ATPase subunit